LQGRTPDPKKLSIPIQIKTKGENKKNQNNPVCHSKTPFQKVSLPHNGNN